MKSFIKQPLVHFLLIGLGFFLIFNFFGYRDKLDSKTIVVDKESLMTYFQYRSKAFNAQVFEDKLASMTKEEQENLIKEYVREEVLYREAMAMGLDREDYIIKRRMIQKVEFISQGIAEAVTDMTDEHIKKYYEENMEDYFIEPIVTFTHVFFDSQKWSPMEAKKKAEAEVQYLNSHNITFSEAPGRGDRFFYHTNYVERNLEYVENHFGSTMAKTILESTSSDKKWLGPFQSQYGFHIVMLTKNEPGRYPDLDDVIDRVTDDARREYTRKRSDENIQGIIDEYEVKLVYDLHSKAETKLNDND